MPANFLFPTITSLPAGYDCTVAPSISALGARLLNGTGAVDVQFRIYSNGEMKGETFRTIEFENGSARETTSALYTWADSAEQWGGRGGFLEIAFVARDDESIFDDKRPISFYAIYSKPGKKLFFSDNAYKFGSPPVIAQIAQLGRFVDGYPVVHIDRSRDLGESIAFINPYHKTIIASILTQDGRRMDRLSISPMSARNVSLDALLLPGEMKWFGQIQITANNRIVTFNIKHSLRDPMIISDYEHLDPYRAEPTHMPLTQYLRQRIGAMIWSAE